MVLGTTYGYGIFLTATLTVLGMMTAIYAITFFGKSIRALALKMRGKKKRRIFTKKNRRNVRIWQKYGVPGIAILTPILLMPVGGAVLANAFGGNKKEIIKWMWLSCIGWTYPLTWLVQMLIDVIPLFQTIRDQLQSWIAL